MGTLVTAIFLPLPVTTAKYPRAFIGNSLPSNMDLIYNNERQFIDLEHSVFKPWHKDEFIKRFIFYLPVIPIYVPLSDLTWMKITNIRWLKVLIFSLKLYKNMSQTCAKQCKQRWFCKFSNILYILLTCILHLYDQLDNLLWQSLPCLGCTDWTRLSQLWWGQILCVFLWDPSGWLDPSRYFSQHQELRLFI